MLTLSTARACHPPRAIATIHPAVPITVSIRTLDCIVAFLSIGWTESNEQSVRHIALRAGRAVVGQQQREVAQIHVAVAIDVAGTDEVGAAEVREQLREIG